MFLIMEYPWNIALIICFDQLKLKLYLGSLNVGHTKNGQSGVKLKKIISPYKDSVLVCDWDICEGWLCVKNFTRNACKIAVNIGIWYDNFNYLGQRFFFIWPLLGNYEPYQLSTLFFFIRTSKIQVRLPMFLGFWNFSILHCS